MNIPKGQRQFAIALSLSVILLTALFLIVPSTQAQSDGTSSWALTKIEFIGLQKLSEADAIAASGLKLGQRVTVADFDIAAQQLVESGLFRKLKYRFSNSNEQVELAFEIEEELRAFAQVVFDNFVWFSDDELNQAIRRLIPSFNGVVSDSSTNGIVKILQQLFEQRQIPGRVEYMLGDGSGRGSEHLFSVEGVNVPVCTVNFPGAGAVSESDLIKSSKSLVGQDYRRSFTASHAQTNLVPKYREIGHLRVQFLASTAKLVGDAGEKCKGGVAITVQINEGIAYRWTPPQWTGNTVFTTEQLNAAIRLKAGEIANGLVFDQGLGTIQEAYGTRGYLVVRFRREPIFEEDARNVRFHITVREGDQYRMGELSITGISEGATNRLKKRWKLRPGDVFDGSYPREFVKNHLAYETGAHQVVETQTKIDSKSLTVGVSFVVKKRE